ncbi:hypothetical protein HanHA89_Chr12g0458131 [Helianthus annuus]|nr:hypothetical protein HanHA89_Chr12g0458131 [Helianthus annuus]
MSGFFMKENASIYSSSALNYTMITTEIAISLRFLLEVSILKQLVEIKTVLRHPIAGFLSFSIHCIQLQLELNLKKHIGITCSA